jgi:hypothetical protein
MTDLRAAAVSVKHNISNVNEDYICQQKINAEGSSYSSLVQMEVCLYIGEEDILKAACKFIRQYTGNFTISSKYPFDFASGNERFSVHFVNCECH